jgi:hypothetical protein
LREKDQTTEQEKRTIVAVSLYFELMRQCGRSEIVDTNRHRKMIAGKSQKSDLYVSASAIPAH